MGTILKKKLVGADGPRPIPFSMADIEAEAEAILAKARAEADQVRAETDAMIQQTKVQAEQIKTDTYDQAHRQGREDGLAEGRQVGTEQALAEQRKDFAEQADALRTTLTDLVAQFDRDRHGLISSAHQELLALAVAIAEKIIRKRIEHDGEPVMESLKSAIELVTSCSAVQIRMNPTDLDRLNLLDPAVAEACLGARELTFVPDQTVELGGSIIQAAGGEIDAQVAAQVDTIVRHLAPTMADKVDAWKRSPHENAKEKPSSS